MLDDGRRPLKKLRKILRWYAPTGSSKSWAMWIDCWAESLRVPELEKVSRRLDLRWKEPDRGDRAGVKDGDFACDDPTGAAWRIIALIDGLAVQVTVHPRVISRRQLLDWVRGRRPRTRHRPRRAGLSQPNLARRNPASRDPGHPGR